MLSVFLAEGFYSKFVYLFNCLKRSNARRSTVCLFYFLNAIVYFNALLAVTILGSQKAESEQERPGVHLRYRCDGGAFRLQRLRAQRKTKPIIVRNYNTNELQHELEVTDEQYVRLALQMNTGKTEVLHRLTDSATAAQSVSVQGNTLEEVHDFTYLGSLISSNWSHDREVTNRESRASAAFWQLAGPA